MTAHLTLCFPAESRLSHALLGSRTVLGIWVPSAARFGLFEPALSGR